MDDVVLGTDGSSVTQQAYIDAPHDQFYDGNCGAATFRTPSLQTSFRLDDTNVAGYIHQLYNTHHRFRETILDLTAFFHSREGTLESLVAKILYSA